ncbi:MAG: TonB-dependent receptor [Ignavibacteriaceae bacterium]|nr:TonB-dependent receptor [Ignavibacteriaceae bacterium]
MKTLHIVLFLLLHSSFHHFSAQEASGNFISGRVLDAVTGETLPGATIVINELPGRGTVTNEKGDFRIKVPLGAYSIRVSQVGYVTLIKTDIIVNAGRESVVSIKLQSTTVEMEGVLIKGDYFDKSIQVNNLSTVVLNAEEVRRSPGSLQDFQRILQSMPGVAFSSDQDNELLVRGGAPNENLVVFDDIEVHSVNHYPNEYNSGGPINMVNVDLIEDIRFSTGGFISKYGDKLSSIITVNTREGRRNTTIAGNANTSFAGAGLILEGGIGDNRGAWLFSARKSYLDLIVGAIGLTAVPQYYDAQYKVTYDLTDKQKLSFSGIFGDDYIDILGEPEITDPLLAGRIDTVGMENVFVRQNQFASGLSLKSLWSKNFFTTTTFSTTRYHYDVDVTTEVIRRTFDGSGKLDGHSTLNIRPLYRQLSDENEYGLKLDMVYLSSPAYEFNAGVSYRTGEFNSAVTIDGDTARYDLDNDGTYETGPIVLPPAVINDSISLFKENKTYAYINNKFTLLNERLVINAGLRYDHFTYSNASELSPRLSLSYYLIPAITNINFAFGYYYQTHAYPIYGDRYKSGVNRNLLNSRALHYIAGLEHIWDEGLKMTIEAYYKKYDRVPVSEELVYLEDKTFRSEKVLNIGEQDSYGIDFVIQQKLVKDIYGTASFSYMNSKIKDFRKGYEGKTIASDYEFPYIFTIILGKRFSGLKSEINEMPFYIRYPSHLLPFSDDMEISFKWRYSSGRAYTPREFTTTEQRREGGVVWSRGSWHPGTNLNSERYPAFHRLDVSFNSRYNFKGWNLVVFLAIQNLYNQKNVAGQSYSSDGTNNTVYQYSFLPVVGIEAEF